MNPFVERHRDKVSDVLSCFDRVVITGTVPDIGYADAMAGYLKLPQDPAVRLPAMDRAPAGCVTQSCRATRWRGRH